MMKKVWIFIFILCVIPTFTVQATEPMMPGTFDVIIESCETSESIHFDVLVNPEDYMEGFDFDVDQVRHEFQVEFPDYQTFDFLVQGEYISYSAYINPLYDYSPKPCTFHLETLIEDDADIYFVIFTDEGDVLYQETFHMDDLGYQDNFRYYTSIVYDVEQNTARLATQRELTIGEIFLLTILGIVLLIIMLISVPLIIVLRHRKQY